MNEKLYKDIVKKNIPKEEKLKNALVSFLAGGFIGFIGEVIIYVLTSNNISSKTSASIMIVMFIFTSSLLTALSFFDNLIIKAKAGLFIPITGFAHAITSSMIDYKKEGLITGIGSNAFKLAGSVILYGIISAYFFASIRYLFFGG